MSRLLLTQLKDVHRHTRTHWLYLQNMVLGAPHIIQESCAFLLRAVLQCHPTNHSRCWEVYRSLNSSSASSASLACPSDPPQRLHADYLLSRMERIGCPSCTHIHRVSLDESTPLIVRSPRAVPGLGGHTRPALLARQMVREREWGQRCYSSGVYGGAGYRWCCYPKQWLWK